MYSKLKSVCFLLIAAHSVAAKVKLPAVLNSHMVLQQKSQAHLWGHAAEEAEVSITTSWDNKAQTVSTDKNGFFSVTVKTPTAGGPYRIVFTDADGDLALKDILVGEVWLCSGQSNMEMPMKGFRNQPILNSKEILKNAENKQLRLYSPKKAVSFNVLDDSEGGWLLSSPESAENTSALAFQFGQMLQKELNVPVGIIISSWGGTPIKSWMSRESLNPIKEVSEVRPDTITSKTPTALYNGMIAPFRNYTLAGFLWYQGENDVITPERYREMMPAMVKDWRTKFQNKGLPFYFVQIAPWVYSRTGVQYAPFFREVQYKLSKSVPKSGIAVTADIGSNKTIHPPDKTKIAERLVKIAMADTYHRRVKHLGPELKSFKIKGEKAVLKFRHGKGLCLKKSESTNFELAGEDGVFHPAKAKVVSGTLFVRSSLVPAPKDVRYAFKNYMVGNLFNRDGLPATPFRTDSYSK